MTVGELIAALNQYPAGRKVQVHIQLKSGDGSEHANIQRLDLNYGNGNVMIPVEFDDVYES